MITDQEHVKAISAAVNALNSAIRVASGAGLLVEIDRIEYSVIDRARPVETFVARVLRPVTA